METFTSLLASAVACGKSVEEGLTELRANGATPVEAIKAIHLVQKVGLGEAKQIFGRSPAWAGEALAGDALHQELISAVAKEQTS